MLKISTSILFISLAVFGCKETAETKTIATENTEEDHNYLVNSTNKAWASEELNKRVSPPKSIVAESENGLKMAIHYSSPFVKRRAIWDSLVPFNKVWRTGANEATIIEFSDDATIKGEDIKAGAYSLFTIPKADGFTVILNKDADQWGAYEYDDTKDAIRFDVTSNEVDFNESLVYDLSGNEESIDLSFAWENRGFSFSVKKAMN